MASWKNDNDIARDLDFLSGIKSPSKNVKSYTTWGRGRPVNSGATEEFENPFWTEDKTPQEEFTWFQKKPILEKLPVSLGRGKRLQILKDNVCSSGRELEVQEQLRAAMGPGHSNAYIEASFKQRLQSNIQYDHGHLPVEQIDDSEEIKSEPRTSEKTKSSLNSNTSENAKSDGSKFVFDNNEICASELSTSNVNCSDVCVSKEMKCPEKKKPRQYRNAVLESLAKRDSSESEVKKNRGSKLANIPPAGYYPGSFCIPESVSSIVLSESEDSFVFKELEFPKL